MKKDFYNILGVPEDAPQDRIKKVYRSLAKKFHPDRNQGDTTAEAKFKEVQEAYSVLSDPKKREEYDMMRKYGNYTGASEAGFGADGMNGFDISDLFRGGANGGRVFHFSTTGDTDGAEDMDELLGSLFGSRGRRRAGAHRSGEEIFAGNRTRRGADLSTSVTIPFLESVTGVTKTLHAHDSNKTIRVAIPTGIDDGGRIRLKGQGLPGLYGGRDGDLIIMVRVMPDQYFKREGNDVHTSVEVSFIDAIKGCKREVRTLSRTVSLTIPPGTQPGTKLRLKGMGLEVGGVAGDQYVEVKVTLPTTLTEKQKKLVEEWGDEK